MPVRDPGSVITVAQVAVRPRIEVSSPALQAAGIRLTVVTKGEFDSQAKVAGMEAMVEDLGKAFLSILSGLAAKSIVRVEVLDAAGKPIPSNGRLTLGGLQSYLFPEPLPPKARMPVHAATLRSLVLLPLQLPPVQLP